MKLSYSWIIFVVLGLFFTGSAPAIVVVEEDFEDDVVDESTFFNWALDENGERVPDSHFDGTHPERGLGFIQHQLGHINGAPTNVGRPGRWIPNQYPIGSPTEDGSGFQDGQWFDPFDVNPDTDWQMAVVTDFRMMSIIRDGPPRDGNEGYLINHHQGDCTSANPCDTPGAIGFTSHKMAREGFIKFTDGADNDVATEAGDVLRGSFMFVSPGGNTTWGLASDIQAIADSTSKVDEDLNGDGAPDHMPVTKWAVGFGQAFNPIDVGLPFWQGEPNLPDVVAQIGFGGGFNQTFLQTSSEDGAQVHLDPDPDNCINLSFEVGECSLALDDPENSPFYRRHTTESGADPHFRYQKLEFQYTVGQTTWDLLQLDGFDVITCEKNQSKDCDPEKPLADNVPITRPGDVIDGIFFGTTGQRNSNALFVDDICITINESLDGCNLTGGEPGTGSSSGGGGGGGGDPEPTVLIGDANNDDQVTGSDLIAVQQNFGTVYPSDANCDGQGPGDANDDCQVTGSDLIAVQQNFGTVATAAPVPEPATSALVGLGLLAATGRRRRA